MCTRLKIDEEIGSLSPIYDLNMYLIRVVLSSKVLPHYPTPTPNISH